MAQELNRVWGMVCEKDRYYYNEKKVDAVLAVKDAKIAQLRGDLKDLWDDKHDTDKLLDERNTEIAELKAENIRLRKRLLRMCASLGKMGYLAFHNIQVKLEMFGDGEGTAMALKEKNRWRNVELKCRAKAEEAK